MGECGGAGQSGIAMVMGSDHETGGVADGSRKRDVRFTRGGQADLFALIGVGMLCVAGAMALLAWPAFLPPKVEPIVGSGWWALVPVALAVVMFGLAVHLGRHAYLLISPVGLEIFPFFFPVRNFRLVMWDEIENLEVGEGRKWLTVAMFGGGGVHISLAPMRRMQRQLLAETVLRAMKMRRPDGLETENTGGRATLRAPD